MFCKKFEKEISLLVDEELSREQAIELQLHFKECSACAAQYQFGKEIEKLIMQQPVPACGENFTTQIMEKAYASACHQKFRWVWAAVILFICGGIFFSEKAIQHFTPLPKELTSNRTIAKKSSDNQKIYPYAIHLTGGKKNYVVVIENKTDEQHWNAFLARYRQRIIAIQRRQKLNRYHVRTIPATLVHYTDF